MRFVLSLNFDIVFRERLTLFGEFLLNQFKCDPSAFFIEQRNRYEITNNQQIIGVSWKIRKNSKGNCAEQMNLAEERDR